jgi:uncharacterized protein
MSRDPERANFHIRDLLRPEAFRHAVTDLTLRETHISWVVLTGPFAYKIKKPVKLDFLDTSTLDRRHHYCNEELRLNRRFAPDLYVDVVGISREGERQVVGNSGPAVEYAVQMHQFADSDELPALLARNAVSASEIAALGELVAQFHLQAAVSSWTGVPERTQAMCASVLDNLDQLLAHLAGAESAERIEELVQWTHENAHALEQVLQAREREGFVRECHGDLHSANIVRWRDRLLPFDCIEFDPQLRWIDVMNDLAFIIMDLAYHERSDLSYALLSRYLEVTGDYAGVRCLPFYAVYRALVRAKVDAISAERVPSRRDEYRSRLVKRRQAATSWTTPRRPSMILMQGVSGSGKSWLSERLVPALHAVRVRSDVERKRLAGVSPTAHAPASIRVDMYSKEFSHRTYGRLAECAESCLRAGVNVILDATFLKAADRELLRTLATAVGAEHTIVSCHADSATLAARVRDRAADLENPSDATLQVLAAQIADNQGFTDSERERLITVDTRRPDAVRHVVSAVTQMRRSPA